MSFDYGYHASCSQVRERHKTSIDSRSEAQEFLDVAVKPRGGPKGQGNSYRR